VLARILTVRPFDRARILSAIARAGAATGELDATAAEAIADQVCKVRGHRYALHTPTVENIQDVVEQALIAADYLVTARAYIVYREQHRKLRADRRTLVDAVTSINEYLDQQDWRVQANANQGYSPGGLIPNVSGKVTANY
jgi:ribonucleoside-triphosphate reductase (formate)